MVAAFKSAQGVMDSLDKMPKYRFLDVEQSAKVDEVLTRVQEVVAEAKERGVKITQKRFLRNILRRIPRDDPMYEVFAVAYLRKTKISGQMWNPARDELVLENPMAVKFYISLFNKMSDANKARFVKRYGTQYFSSDYNAENSLEGAPGDFTDIEGL